jgi:hypothetical protein
MKVDSAVVLAAVGALLLVGVLGILITDQEIRSQLIPDGNPEDPLDYINVTVEIRPFLKVGASSILFGMAVFILFAVAVAVRRIRR